MDSDALGTRRLESSVHHGTRPSGSVPLAPSARAWRLRSAAYGCRTRSFCTSSRECTTLPDASLFGCSTSLPSSFLIQRRRAADDPRRLGSVNVLIQAHGVQAAHVRAHAAMIGFPGCT